MPSLDFPVHFPTRGLLLLEPAAGAAPPRARDLRFRVEHAQVLAESDIPRFGALGVLPSMQATHCTSDMPWAEARLGPERLRGAYAWRSLLATGVIVPGAAPASPDPTTNARSEHATASELIVLMERLLPANL